ncbi:MAG TPA: S-adenosylmethionine:tRNA ribosyltransferase-isomerase [Gaiellaceae bacterium]
MDLVAALEAGPARVEAAGPVELLDPRRHRDEVRLLVAGPDRPIEHAAFADLPAYLGRGDVVVVNRSATLPAALDATLDGNPVRVHVSSAVPGSSRRLVELRRPDGTGSAPYASGAGDGVVVVLPGGGEATLVVARLRSGKAPRLWEAELRLPLGLADYLHAYGEPIRYGYVSRPWALASYQTIFARFPGSSEMPSAGRPFSWRLVRRLRAKGVVVTGVTLHAGVASLERDERPTPEPFAIPAAAARLVNCARAGGKRVVAVGTTVVRALESATDETGRVRATAGTTDLVIERGRELRIVTGLLTGFHEPDASHIELLAAVGGDSVVRASYAEAVARGYLWHEFGDLHLLLRA